MKTWTLPILKRTTAVSFSFHMWWGAQQAFASTNCWFGFHTQPCRLDTSRDWQTNWATSMIGNPCCLRASHNNEDHCLSPQKSHRDFQMHLLIFTSWSRLFWLISAALVYVHPCMGRRDDCTEGKVFRVRGKIDINVPRKSALSWCFIEFELWRLCSTTGYYPHTA